MWSGGWRVWGVVVVEMEVEATPTATKTEGSDGVRPVPLCCPRAMRVTVRRRGRQAERGERGKGRKGGAR